MDISLLKTFLEVSRRRHFGKAAEHLFLPQSAVSARIKLLEATLGVELFSRKRNDIQLTPAGQRLLRHARTIVDGWDQARQSIALDESYSHNLAVGALGDIWSMQLLDWASRLRLAQPQLAMQLESYSADTLQQRLTSGLLDIAFVFDPPQSPEYVIKEIATLELMLIATREGLSVEEALQQNFIMVDWGTSFALKFAHQLSHAPLSALRVNQGRLAVDLLTQQSGSAYLPTEMVSNQLHSGQLHKVAGAPVMERIVYAAYRPDAQCEELVRQALAVPWHP